MKFEIFKDEAGEFRWRLVAKNGNIVAVSGEGYEKKAAIKRSIKSIQAKAADAKVEELVDQPA